MKLRRLGRRSRRGAARRAARALIGELPNLLRLLLRLIRDARIGLREKLVFGLVVAYTLAPADLIPDILLPLGLVDDLYLLGLALAGLFRRAGADILLEHWDGDPAALGYLVEGVEQLGELLPGPVRRALRVGLRKAG